VFGNLRNNPVIHSLLPPDAHDRAFSSQVMAYWTNFAKHGSPNAQQKGLLPIWPAYGSGAADTMELGSTSAPINYNLERLRFIASFRLDGVLPASWRLLNVSASGV